MRNRREVIKLLSRLADRIYRLGIRHNRPRPQRSTTIGSAIARTSRPSATPVETTPEVASHQLHCNLSCLTPEPDCATCQSLTIKLPPPVAFTRPRLLFTARFPKTTLKGTCRSAPMAFVTVTYDTVVATIHYAAAHTVTTTAPISLSIWNTAGWQPSLKIAQNGNWVLINCLISAVQRWEEPLPSKQPLQQRQGGRKRIQLIGNREYSGRGKTPQPAQ
jgi:hypothetical protein